MPTSRTPFAFLLSFTLVVFTMKQKCLPYKTVIVIYTPPSSTLSFQALRLLLLRLTLRETNEGWLGGWVEMVKMSNRKQREEEQWTLEENEDILT